MKICVRKLEILGYVPTVNHNVHAGLTFDNIADNISSGFGRVRDRIEILSDEPFVSSS